MGASDAFTLAVAFFAAFLAVFFATFLAVFFAAFLAAFLAVFLAAFFAGAFVAFVVVGALVVAEAIFSAFAEDLGVSGDESCLDESLIS